MGILLSARKNFKVILKIIILNYYLICNHLRIFACQKRVKSFCPSNTLRSLLFRWSSAVMLKECINSITLTICRSEESRRLIAGIESDKASHKTDHDI